jgi:hypothetical protein
MQSIEIFGNNNIENEKLINKLLNNYTSFLISGGLNENFEIPIYKYEKEIKFLKENNKLLNFHIGFLKEKNFFILNYADAISIDIIGSSIAIKNIYGIDKKPTDYINLLDQILKYKGDNKLNFKIVPHITIGLDYGKDSGEKEVIQILKNYKNIDKIVFNILKKTESVNFDFDINLNYIKEILICARENLKEKILFIGCMRPSGIKRKEIDNFSFHIGFDGIVNPSFKYKEYFKLFNNCCSLF